MYLDKFLCEKDHAHGENGRCQMFQKWTVLRQNTNNAEKKLQLYNNTVSEKSSTTSAASFII